MARSRTCPILDVVIQATTTRSGGWHGFSSGLVEPAEHRRETRLVRTFRATLSVHGGALAVVGVDIHHHGLGVVSRRPVPAGRLVCFRLEDAGLVGFAYVRHCTASGEAGYRIGLELRDTLVRVETPAGDWKYKQLEPGDVPVIGDAVLR